MAAAKSVVCSLSIKGKHTGAALSPDSGDVAAADGEARSSEFMLPHALRKPACSAIPDTLTSRDPSCRSSALAADGLASALTSGAALRPVSGGAVAARLCSSAAKTDCVPLYPAAAAAAVSIPPLTLDNPRDKNLSAVVVKPVAAAPKVATNATGPKLEVSDEVPATAVSSDASAACGQHLVTSRSHHCKWELLDVTMETVRRIAEAGKGEKQQPEDKHLQHVLQFEKDSHEQQSTQQQEQWRSPSVNSPALHQSDLEAAGSKSCGLPRSTNVVLEVTQEDASSDCLSEVGQEERPGTKCAGEGSESPLIRLGKECKWSGNTITSLNRADTQMPLPLPEDSSAKQMSERRASMVCGSTCSSTSQRRSGPFSSIRSDSSGYACSGHARNRTVGADGRREESRTSACTCPSPRSDNSRQTFDGGRALSGARDVAGDVPLCDAAAHDAPERGSTSAAGPAAVAAEAPAFIGVCGTTAPAFEQAAATGCNLAGPALCATLHDPAGMFSEVPATRADALTTATGAAKGVHTAAEGRVMTRRKTTEMCSSSISHVNGGAIGDSKCSAWYDGDGQQRHKTEHELEQEQQEREARIQQVHFTPKRLHQHQQRTMPDGCLRFSLDENSGVKTPPVEVLQLVRPTADPTSSSAAQSSDASLTKAEEARTTSSPTFRGAGGAPSPGSKATAGEAVAAAGEAQGVLSLDQSVHAAPVTDTIDSEVKDGTVCRIGKRREENHSWQAPDALASAPVSVYNLAAGAATVGGFTVAGAARPAATPGGSSRAAATPVIMSASCYPGGVAFVAGDTILQGCASVDKSGISARRSLSRNAVVQSALATPSVGAVGVTRCSPRHIRKPDRPLVETHQQQPRGSVVPSSGFGVPLAAAACTSLFQSTSRPVVASSGSSTSKNISLKRKTCTSSGKNRSGGGRCISNSTRKNPDATSIRFDASWFLPQEGWSHCDCSFSFYGGSHKRLKRLRREDEAAAGNVSQQFAPSQLSNQLGTTKNGMWLSGNQESQPSDAVGGSAMTPEAVEATQSNFLSRQQGNTVSKYATSSGETVEEGTAQSSTCVRVNIEPNWRFVEDDSALVSSCDSEEEEELDTYLSDVEAAARALDDPLSPARRLQPYERPRCCVCGLPLRPAVCSSRSDDRNSGSGGDNYEGGNGLTDGYTNVRSNSTGVAAWEPLCACVPRSFGANTLQGRAAKDTLLCPPAATPLQYTLYTLLLKPSLPFDNSNTTNSGIQAVSSVSSSGGSPSGGGNTHSGTSSNSDGSTSGWRNIQSSSSAQSSNKTQLGERLQDGCSSAQAGSRNHVQCSSSCDRGGSLRNESGSLCRNNSTGNSGIVVENFSASGSEGSADNTIQKTNRRFCRWRDLATLQNFCAPLEQLQDSLAATVASAAAAGAAAGRPVAFLPRLFWDRETDCYVASCLGYCRTSSSSGTGSGKNNGSASSRSGTTVADADVDLRLLQKRFSVGFLGDAKAHFYACMWLNWHYEQANVVQRKQQQLRQEFLEQHEQLLHLYRGKGGAISQPGAAGQLRNQQVHCITSACWKDPQRSGNVHGAAAATSLWKQQKQNTDTAGFADETEEERKARLRQESLARQKRHKLERQQWRRQQARLARLLLQQQQQQQQQQQRHSTKQHQQQNQQQHGQHVLCAAAARAGSVTAEQTNGVTLLHESRITRATSNSTSFHSQQQRSPGDAVPAGGSTRAAAGATGDKTSQQTGRGLMVSSSGRKTGDDTTAGAMTMSSFPRETPGNASSGHGIVATALDFRTTSAPDTCHNAADTVSRGTVQHYSPAAGGLQVPACSSSLPGSRLHRKSDGTQTPPLARGSSRDYSGASSRSGSSNKANRASTPNSTSHGSSTTSASKGNNRSCSSNSVVSSTSSRGGSSVGQSSRSGTSRSGPLKQGSSSFVSPAVGKGAGGGGPGQATLGAGGTGTVAPGAAETVAASCGIPTAAFRSDAGGGSPVVSAGIGFVASAAAGGSRRAGESSTELVDSTSASTAAAGGKAKGRINARKCAATTKPASTVPEKQLLSKAKGRSSPPLAPAATATLPAAASAATTVVGAGAATPSMPRIAGIATSAVTTPEFGCTVHTSTNATQTRGAVRTAGVATATSRPESQCTPGAGGGTATGGYRGAEGACTGGERRDIPAGSNTMGYVERRCRAARTSPRCLSLAPGAGAVMSGGATPTKGTAASAVGATSAAVLVVAEAEKRNVPQGAYASLLSVSSPAAGCVATAESATPAAVGALNNSRGGGVRGRGSGAAVLGTPEKLKISTRAHQRSAGSAVIPVAAAGPCNGGSIPPVPQQGQLRGERTAMTHAVDAGSVVWKSTTESALISSRTAASTSSKDTESVSGLCSSRQPVEETQTGRAAPAGRTATTAAESSPGGVAAEGMASGATKGEGKLWKNWGSSAGEDRRWASSARQRQSRRQRETRR